MKAGAASAGESTGTAAQNGSASRTAGGDASAQSEKPPDPAKLKDPSRRTLREAREERARKDEEAENRTNAASSSAEDDRNHSISRLGSESSFGPGSAVSWPKVIFSVFLMTGVAMGAVCLFSDVFATGESVVDALLDFGAQSWYVFACVVAIATVVYVLDVSYWGGLHGKVARRLTLLLLAAGACLQAISLIREQPYLPLVVFIFMLPIAALGLRFTGLRSNNAIGVSRALGTAFLVAAFVCLFVWLLWLYGAWGDASHNMWHDNRAYFAELAHCNNTAKYGSGGVAGQTVVDGVVICTAAFLLWVSPFVIFGVLLFLGLFFVFMARLLSSGKRRSHEKVVRVIAIAVFCAFFGMYSASSVGGAEMGLANVALATYATVIAAIVMVAGATVGWGELSNRMREQTKRTKFGVTTLNFAHAFAVCFGALPFLVFLALSYVNQQARKIAGGCGVLGVCKPLVDAERGQPLTSLAMHRIEGMRRWDWAKTLTYVFYLCALVWVFKVFSNFTYIFFNWLTTVLRDLPFGWVCIIFVLIGLAMFLIPVVPGPAVYLTAGVLMVPLGKKTFSGSGATFDPCNQDDDEELDAAAFWASAAFASTLSFTLKLIAHVLQQKMIGETFRHRVEVRAIVGPNTQVMRASRYILSQPGVTLAKASLLCGGPDWPTSVICGLLGLNCCQMVIGLTPIVFFTTPGTLLGAFMTERTYTKINLQAVCLLVVLLVQLLMGVVFSSHCYKVIATKGDILDAYPLDEEVAKLDEEKKNFEDILHEVGEFEMAPRGVRAVLITGTVASVGSVYALVLAGSSLFQPFSITDCIDGLGVADEDAAWHEAFAVPMLGIKVLGAAMLVAIFYGYFALWYFKRWQRRQAQARVDERQVRV